MTAAEVIRAAMELSPVEREEVAQALLETIEGGVDQAETDDAWKTEIGSRLDDIRAGRFEGLTRDEVKSFLNERRVARAV